MLPITSMKHMFNQQTIYVLGSGSSMDYVDPSFFKDKLTICVNDTWKKYPATFIVYKEYEYALEAAKIHDDWKLVVSEYACGGRGLRNDLPIENYYQFRHLENRHDIINLAPLDDNDKLVVSWSTITSAIHFAYFLGAKDIILCGHDCGLVDGNCNYRGYYDAASVSGALQPPLVVKFEQQTLQLVQELRRRGVNVMSLNPFINFGLEGHSYSKGV